MIMYTNYILLDWLNATTQEGSVMFSSGKNTLSLLFSFLCVANFGFVSGAAARIRIKQLAVRVVCM